MKIDALTVKTMSTLAKQSLGYGSWYLAGTTINGLLMGTLLRKITKQFTLDDVGTIVAIATFSWCAKPLFGLMVDKWKNRYWWAMAASVVMVPLMIFLPYIGTDTVMACTIAMLLPTLVQTTRDTAVDALALALYNIDGTDVLTYGCACSFDSRFA